MAKELSLNQIAEIMRKQQEENIEHSIIEWSPDSCSFVELHGLEREIELERRRDTNWVHIHDSEATLYTNLKTGETILKNKI